MCYRHGLDSFWRLLDGDDTITGALVANAGQSANFTIFGDGIAGRAGTTGGDDRIDAGDTRASIYGDVFSVSSQLPGDVVVAYRGGDDRIEGRATDRVQYLIGDTAYVLGTGRLTGGNDDITARSSSIESFVVGDAVTIADQAQVLGGNDILRAVGDSQPILVGDVTNMSAGSFVRGGNDLIAANRFAANAAGVATTLDQRFVYQTDTGILRFDANGSATGDVTTIAILTGAPTLSVGDFLIL